MHDFVDRSPIKGAGVRETKRERKDTESSNEELEIMPPRNIMKEQVTVWPKLTKGQSYYTQCIELSHDNFS